MSDEEVMETFLTQFYGNGREIPPEILLSHHTANAEIIEQWMKSMRGRNVKLHVPARGDRKKQIDLAVKMHGKSFSNSGSIS